MTYVWVTYETPKDCQCWREVVCPHGLTWQDDIDSCDHLEGFNRVCESFADAVREMFGWRGADAIGQLVRRKSRGDLGTYGLPIGSTVEVFVMRERRPYTCNHDVEGVALDDSAPQWVIRRERVQERTYPGDSLRRYAADYRRQIA